jgi:hypothetical protein
VFAGENETLAGPPKIEVRVAEGMNVTGTTEPLTGSESPGSILSGVMHQHDREVEPPLKRTKVGQQPGYFRSVVLVDPVQSHQRIKKKEARPQSLGRLEEPRAVWFAIEPKRGGGDHMHLDSCEIESAMPSHSLDPFSYDRQCILGQVD